MARFFPISFPLSAIAVDRVLFQLRWILLLLVLPTIWLDAGAITLSTPLVLWIVSGVIFNSLVGLLLRFPTLAKFLPLPSLIVDTILFGSLPYLAITGSNLLAYFSIFPAIVAAIRFWALGALVVATLLSISLGIHFFLPLQDATPRTLISTALPVIVIDGLTILTGYLTHHEKVAAVRQAAGELDELRDAVAGAQLLYQTSDWLSSSANYKPILESMLDAGVKGLPQARREDGLPVGLALVFDEQDPQMRLRVAAARGMDIRDEKTRIEGKRGIVAQALSTGEFVVFDRVDQDPELGLFRALQFCRCGVCYPLRAGLDLYGVVVLATPAPRQPSPQHLELMQAFTRQAGIAFQNATLYQKSRQEQDRIIQDDIKMRQKLARDLHDGPTQKVSGLAMQLEYIAKLIDANPAEAKAELAKAQVTAQQTIKEMRTALFMLRPLSLEKEGLSAALEQLGQRLREVDNVPIQVVPGDFGTELDPHIATTVFAIIEEAINNARKHGKGAPIQVSLQRQNNSLVAIVQDQGPGFDLDAVEKSYGQRASLGLQNMRERAKLIDGNLNILSAIGHGTRVTLVVPLPSNSLAGRRK
ncbi:MAG: GAF domain-containing sensor histidine kinase [Anaerolineae bacterium]|nr:GAF domain-containing sensor histidine kinase [Anaerolineae bacterium]